MPFTDFTLSQVTKEFGLRTTQLPFFEHVTPQAASDWLIESLERGSSLAFNSEKSRSEYMIAPVLLEVRAFAQDQLLIRPHFAIQRNHKQSPIHD